MRQCIGYAVNLSHGVVPMFRIPKLIPPIQYCEDSFISLLKPVTRRLHFLRAVGSMEG
ncbi:MAG: hypothetical protein RLZZ408_445 [Verrucomicrobiota bacterium]